MKFSSKIVSVLGAASLMLASTFVSAEVVVIVNAKSPVNSATAEDVARIFLGKRNDIAGSDFVAVDQSEGNPSRAEFYQKVVQKDDTQLHAYWSRLIFTGKGSPPERVGGDADVADAVTEDMKAIGYIDASAITEGVKVIYTVK